MQRIARLTMLAMVVLASACASAPATISVSPDTSYEQKLSWILRLEDQRVLRVPVPEPDPQQPAAVRSAASPGPDLTRLLTDRDARIRRRAALAIGRVGLPAGVVPLVPLLSDAEPEVRRMTAFALGLIGDRSAVGPLIAALADPVPLVRGGAAEGLGLIGDPSAAEAIGRLASSLMQSGAVATTPGDQADADRDTPAAVLRYAVFALVRLQAFDALAAAVLDPAGQPRTDWWPVAFALQRLEDPRAVPALRTLVGAAHPYTRAFAIKGLGATRDRASIGLLQRLLTGGERIAAIEAARALARLGDAAAAPALMGLVTASGVDPTLRVEAATALATLGGEGASDVLINLLGDADPQVRAAALQGLARLDGQGFVFILSGLDPDTHWTVRAALATVLATLPPETALPRLQAMLADPDQRVIPSVLTAIAALRAPDAAQTMTAHLKAEDPVVRAAAARGLGEVGAADGAAALVEAYRLGQRDLTYVARAAALDALAKSGRAEGVDVLLEALRDPDWAVRLRAAPLVQERNPAADAFNRIRPVPSPATEARYAAPHVINPPVSTQLYVETTRGTIQIELAMLDAPLTVEHIVTLARRGFYDGLTVHRVVPGFVIQTGDPRGDGEGGPGYTIRDELNDRPYLRGTVGMALDWEDTGGSQFFITHSPQPHLDARYTVIGRVLAGMDVVDRIRPWDTVTRVIVWDGQSPSR